MKYSRPAWYACVVTGLLLGLQAELFAAPTIGNLSLRGLKVGATTTLAVDGAELGPDARLLLSVPSAKQTLKPGATANRAEFEVALDDQTPPGIYLLRLATAGGISNAVLVGVDTLAQAPFAPEVAELPVALTGALNGSTVLTTAIVGRSGQRLVVEVESRRLGANLNPTLHLYNERHVQLAWSQGRAAIAGDARLETVLPADGRYTIELHDTLFRGADPGFFRLKVGDFQYADFVLPLGVTRGTPATFAYAETNLPPALTASAQLADVGEQPAPWPAGKLLLSGSRPRLQVSSFPEILAARPGEQPQELPAAPVAVSGRLQGKTAEHRFRLPVTPGQQLRLDVLANRIGSPLDGLLTVLNEQGGQLGTNDDRPGTSDPGLDVTVPADAKSVIVAVRDLERRGGENFVYRLSVLPVGRPDFSITLAEDRLAVPRDGALVLRIKADRAGYQGPIQLSLDPPLANVALANQEIPAGLSEVLYSLAAAGVDPAQHVGRLVARSTDPQMPLERFAETGDAPALRAQPWLRREFGLAVTPAAVVALAWDDFSAGTSLQVGTGVPIHVRVTRAAGAMGAVRVTLLTTQAMPKKTIKENNQDKLVDDVDRALRLDVPLLIPADQSEATAKILVPGDLPLTSYDLALKAELLAADNQNAVASAFAPARRLNAVGPISIELTSAAQVEGRAGLGTPGKLTGKIIRAAGFAAPITVRLAGLPNGVVGPQTLVPGDQNNFELGVTFPYGTAAGDLAGVKLVASAQLDPQVATSVVRSNEIPVAVKVVPGEKPAAEQPLALFEDQAEFVATLKQGAGQAALEANDKFSGTAALKVTPDQRHSDVNALAIKIREKPGPGEYRFIQFAWRKQGGQSICLQLNHDGQWGQIGTNPAKFRYHAGPGPECYTASLAVSPTLPAGFTVVTRDLFADFGEFMLTGLAFSPIDGEFAVFDHIYLGKSPADFDLVKP